MAAPWARTAAVALAAVSLLFPAGANGKPCLAKDVYKLKADGSFNMMEIDLHHCRKLDLRYQDIMDEEAEVLGEALATNTQLHRLNLGYGNSIKLAGARAIGKALSVNKHLRWLHIGGNKLDGAGGEAIAAALAKNKQSALAELHLNHNTLGYAGVKAVADMLRTNTALITLSLIDNSIGDAVGKVLASAMEENKALKKLDLRRNVIQDSGAEAIENMLAKNTALVYLPLYGNAKVTADRRKSIFALVAGNKARAKREAAHAAERRKRVEEL